MPLTLFNHETRTVHRSVKRPAANFEYSFGGDVDTFKLRFPKLKHPLHLMYRLDLRDSCVPNVWKGLKYLPLVYGFQYAGHDSDHTYKIVNETMIELVHPANPEWDRDFPYEKYPSRFPYQRVDFETLPHDVCRAEDALLLQDFFAVDRLSNEEHQRAISICEGIMTNRGKSIDFSDELSPEDIERNKFSFYENEFFYQGSPADSCENPKCTAPIVDRIEERVYDFPSDDFAKAENNSLASAARSLLHKLFPKKKLVLPAYDVRAPSLHVFAIEEPEQGDGLLFGDSYIKIIFQYCDYCGCIRVTNQCT